MVTINNDKPFSAPYWDITQPKQLSCHGNMEYPHHVFDAATIEELVNFYLTNPQFEFYIVLYKNGMIATGFDGENGEVLLNGKIRRSFRNRLNKVFEWEKNQLM